MDKVTRFVEMWLTQVLATCSSRALGQPIRDICPPIMLADEIDEWAERVECETWRGGWGETLLTNNPALDTRDD